MQTTAEPAAIPSTYSNSLNRQPVDEAIFRLREIDQLRREIQTTSDRQTDALNRAVSEISDALAAQRHREWESMQSTNRTIAAVAGLFGGLGILAIFCISILQTRSLNRMAAMMGALHQHQSAPHLFDGYSMNEAELAFNQPASLGLSKQRYLQTSIQALEQRFNDFRESLNQGRDLATPAQPESVRFSGQHKEAMPSEPTVEPAPMPVSDQDELTALLGKGETLLNLKDFQAALGCFQLALDRHGNNASTLLKRAKTLEHLNRLDEAIASYDEALACDPTLTMAHLGKAGILNRWERFDDALACYEQALAHNKASKA